MIGCDSRNLPEAICFWSLTLTWAFYAIGGLYIVGPVIAWVLLFMIFLSLYLGPFLKPSLQPVLPLPPIIWAWIIGMLVMLLSLWIAHVGWNLGLAMTIKSSIGWAKGWALAAIFPLIGAVFKIRREVLIRGHCLLGLQTLLLLPVLLIAPMIGLPEKIFVSPLQAAGGPGPEYFTVYFYTIDPSNGSVRWQFYAPWSPFAGLLGVVMVLFALEEKKKFWTFCGLLAGIAMIWFSKSRMSLVGLVVCTAIPRILPLIVFPWVWKMLAIIAATMAVFGDNFLILISDSVDAFREARMDSTRVREALQRIAYDRWFEAFWFGHGIVEPGPHLVERMPIGSHHTWFGLLFVKGIVGFFALAVPLTLQLFISVIDTVRSARGRLPLAIVLTFILLSFGENIEIEAYMLWPALMMMGIHLREIATKNTFN